MNVVLVPGFGTYKNAQWHISPFYRWFEEDGFTVHKYGHAHHGTKSILSQSRDLGIFLENKEIESAALIGHSMGGLVSKLATYGQPLVTIGSPLRGTPWAYLAGWCKAGQDMQPGNYDDYQYDHNAELNISCRYDLIVPGLNSVSPGNKNYKIVDHTHISAIFSRKVYEYARDHVLQYSLEEAPNFS